jgi:SepF-like predicted cell division protein (DUF552 family)
MVKVAGGALIRRYLRRTFKNSFNSKEGAVKLLTRRSINDVTNIIRRMYNGNSF